MYSLAEVAADREAFRKAVRERQAYRPLYVKIKLIYGCNLRCQMCNHWRAPREAPLTIPRLKAVLDELAALGCRKIHFTGGEPLLRPHVPDLTAYATARGIRVNMTTNGTLVEKDLAKRLVEAGLRGVNVSLDSPERKLHDRVRGVDGAWKQTTRALEYFSRFAHKGKLAIRINTVVSRLNYTSLGAMPELAHALGAESLNLIPVDDHCGEHLALRSRDIARFNTTIAPQIAERALALGVMQDEREAYPFGRSLNEVRSAKHGEYALGWYKRHPCFAPWTHSLIDFNGLVYMCCMTREQIAPLGDLKQTSFTDIWTGAGYEAIRKLMHPPRLAACRRCDDFLGENQKLYEVYHEEGVDDEAAQ